MTKTEAMTFVDSEIRPRYRTLNETQFTDWVRAAEFSDLTTAKAIVRDLALDPDSGLTLRAFRREQYNRRPKEQRQAAAFPGYDAYVRCVEAPKEHPEWEDCEWFRTEGFRRSDCGDKEYVTAYARHQAELVQAAEGGRWTGVVRPIDSTPYTGPLSNSERREQAEAHVLAGPDSPGRRALERLRGTGAPAQSYTTVVSEALTEQEPTPPTREQIGRKIVEAAQRVQHREAGEGE